MRAGLGKRAHEGGGDRPRAVVGLPRRTCYSGLSTALPRCRPHRPACCRPPKRSPARPPRSAFLGLVQLADHRDRRRARARGPCARVPKAIRRLLPAARSPRPARPPTVRVRADGYFSALSGELHSDFQSAKRHRAGRADARAAAQWERTPTPWHPWAHGGYFAPAARYAAQDAFTRTQR